MTTSESTPTREGGEANFALARTRIAAAAAAGVVVAAGSAVVLPWQAAVLLGWDAAAITWTVWVWVNIRDADAATTARLATREDPSRAMADLLLVVASVACLIGVGLILIKAADAHGGAKAGLVVVGVLSVLLAWATVHTVYTLRYAGLYYGEEEGGVDFNEDDPPRYLDFAYLAFTIGMTYQVSDTDLKTKVIRATALRQALLSYLFGTGIVAMMINVVAGLLK